LNAELLDCFKSHGGLPAVRWDLDPTRKRLTSKNTEPWARKTVVLNDIFAPGFDNDQLDMLFKKIILLTDTQFVILTAHPSRMHEYMVRIWRLSESGYRDRPEWLQYFTWFKPWKNIWFGITVKDDQDADTVTSLTQMPSYRRFIVLEGDVQLATAWMIPKCTRCNGRGWYLISITGPSVVCRECPGWDLRGPYARPTEGEARAHMGNYLKDRREHGGEVGWVIVPDLSQLSADAFNTVLSAQRQYGTAVYVPGMPRRLRQNPL
jgi:hypothetical protein